MTTVVLEHLQHANSGGPDLTVGPGGEIGVNTSTPTTNTGYTGLDLRAPAGGNGSIIELTEEDGTRNGRLLANSNGVYIGTRYSKEVNIVTNDTNRITVTNVGRVGIGTTSPFSALEVTSTANDPYTATDFNNVPVITLTSPDVVNNYTGIRYTNSIGTYEWYAGSHQTGSQSADFVVQGYDRTNNGYKEHLRVQDTGEILQKYQPAFQAWANAGSNEHFGGGSNPSFGAIGLNVSNSFDGTTFTAPVAGKYLFSYSILSGTSGDYGLIALNINGSPAVGSQNWTQHYTTASNDQQNSSTQILNLAENDQVNLYIHPTYNHFYWQGQYSKFCGYLLG